MSSLPPRTLHALRQLHAHGLGDAALQTVYQAVVDARLLFASSAWWGLHHDRRPAAYRGIFYVVVCVLDTAEQTNERLRSWLKT